LSDPPPPLPDLERDAHKGSVGRVLCFAGSRTMPGAAILVDLEFAYRFTDHIQFALGANNLFDEKPNKLAPDSGISFISRNNIQFPMRGLAYGLNGGFYYARIALNF